MAGGPIDVDASVVTQFAADIQIAVSNNLLIELTRDDHQSGSPTVNTTRLEKAIAYAMGRFNAVSGFKAQTEDPSHVDAITEGTLAILQSWKDGESERARERSVRFNILCRNLREIYTAEATGTSQLTPENEVSAGETRPPDHDRSNYMNYLPSPSRGRRRLFSTDYPTL